MRNKRRAIAALGHDYVEPHRVETWLSTKGLFIQNATTSLVV